MAHPYEVQIREVAPQPLAAARGHGKVKDFVRNLFALLDEVWKFLKANPQVKHEGLNVFLYHDEGEKGSLFTEQGLPLEAGGKVAGPFESVGVIGLYVRKTRQRYRAIYAAIGTRFGAYSICEVVSNDGLHWERGQPGENLSLAPQGTGWESQMVEYPSVAEENGRLRLFYCGNGYGRTGIGTAIAANQPDGAHFSAKGCTIYAESSEPAIKSLLGKSSSMNLPSSSPKQGITNPEQERGIVSILAANYRPPE
jgi:hypothetical protein